MKSAARYDPCGMEKFIVRCIGLVFDRLPYVVGRLAVFVFTWGNLRCERWQPLTWYSEQFTQPWWGRVNGKLIITRWAARWIGALLLVALTAAVLVAVFLAIMRSFD